MGIPGNQNSGAVFCVKLCSPLHRKRSPSLILNRLTQLSPDPQRPPFLEFELKSLKTERVFTWQTHALTNVFNDW